MVRKSSQNGSGHLPLTSHERKTYSKAGDYGTTSQRLSGISQRTFGHCCLGLAPAKEDPVATPSGHIYERSAILEYLLTKTQELKQQQDAYDRQVAAQEAKQQEELNTAKRKEVESFEATQKVVSSKKQKVDDSVNPLAKTSYWLSEFGPEGAKASDLKEPPKRPPSPNSQRPLRRKDLIPLALRFNESDQAICGVSEKTISAQQALALIPKKSDKPAQVVLESVYQDLGSDKVCPISGAKLQKILKLQTGGSSFASSGNVMASKYNHTMT